MKYTETTRTEKRQYKSVDLDYTLLDVKKSLPSRGSFYPFQFIYIRGLRFREQLEITSIDKISDPILAYNSVMRIYRECVQFDNPDYTFDQLLYDDLYALCLWIIILTNKQQKWTIQHTCQHCNKDISFPINTYGDIDLKEMVASEPVTIDTELGKLLIAPRTVEEGLLFNAITDEYKESMIDSQLIKRLNGKPLTMQERLDTYGMLSVQDIDNLSNIANDFKVFINPIEKTCPECKQVCKIIPIIDITKGLP